MSLYWSEGFQNLILIWCRIRDKLDIGPLIVKCPLNMDKSPIYKVSGADGGDAHLSSFLPYFI